MQALQSAQSEPRQLRWLGVAMLALAAVFPWLGGSFFIRLAIESLLLGTVALSVDILLGYAGLLSLGQAAYFGLAAYISALMYLHVTPSFWLVWLAVVAIVAVLSLALGAVAIRAKGVYFALITFGAAEILSKIVHNTRAIGGSDGLIGIPVPRIPLLPGVAVDLHNNMVFYYVVLAVIVLIYVGTRRVLNTGFGSVLRAIRDNSDRVPYLGYNPFWYKLLAYVMAAQIAAFGGLIYPLLRGFVAPIFRLRNFHQGRGGIARRRNWHAAWASGRQRPHHLSRIGCRQLHRAASLRVGRHLRRLRHVLARRPAWARAPPGRAPEGTVVIKVSALSKAFGGLRAVSNLSFEAAPNRITSIIGPNGAGKSTAFNLISGSLRPDSGTVELGGRDVTGQPPHALARIGVARSFQITNLFFGLSALENVRLACQSRERRSGYLARLDRPSRPHARAQAMLAEFGLQDRAGELVRNLSHGDQRRIEIAVCMALDPKLLMLDEPTQGMSPAETAEFDALIKSLAGRVTILLIEHDVDLVMSLSDHVIVMHQGEKLFEGSPEQVRASRRVREAYLGVDDAAA